MSKKLQTDLSYIKRCGYCGNEVSYCMRTSNINSSITDESARQIAQTYLGKSDIEYCDNCDLTTLHTRVGYNLPEVA